MITFVTNTYTLIIFCVFFMVSFCAYPENPRIGVFTDKPFYNSGEIPKIFVSAVNRDIESQTVDVHVGLIDPNDRIFEYPDWNSSLSPWLPLLELAASFEFPATFITDTANFPGGITPGLWLAGVALTKPGTFEFISVETVPFSILPVVDQVDRKFAQIALILDNDMRRLENGKVIMKVTLNAGFLSVSGNFTNAIAFIVGPQAEIEQCSLGVFKFDVPTLNLEPEINATFLDAGSELFVTANSGAQQKLVNIAPRGFSNYATQPEPPIEFYQVGETYTINSLGGADIGSFNASAKAPQLIIVSQPNIASPFIINPEQNLNLQWNGNDGIGEVIVTLLAPNLLGTDNNSYMIKCRFADDGVATVPTALLKQLKDLTNPGIIFLPEFSIKRAITSQYRTSDKALDYGFFEIQTITSSSYSFVE